MPSSPIDLTEDTPPSSPHSNPSPPPPTNSDTNGVERYPSVTLSPYTEEERSDDEDRFAADEVPINNNIQQNKKDQNTNHNNTGLTASVLHSSINHHSHIHHPTSPSPSPTPPLLNITGKPELIHRPDINKNNDSSASDWIPLNAGNKSTKNNNKNNGNASSSTNHDSTANNRSDHHSDNRSTKSSSPSRSPQHTHTQHSSSRSQSKIQPVNVSHKPPTPTRFPTPTPSPPSSPFLIITGKSDSTSSIRNNSSTNNDAEHHQNHTHVLRNGSHMATDQNTISHLTSLETGEEDDNDNGNDHFDEEDDEDILSIRSSSSPTSITPTHSPNTSTPIRVTIPTASPSATHHPQHKVKLIPTPINPPLQHKTNHNTDHTNYNHSNHPVQGSDSSSNSSDSEESDNDVPLLQKAKPSGGSTPRKRINQKLNQRKNIGTQKTSHQSNIKNLNVKPEKRDMTTSLLLSRLVESGVEMKDKSVIRQKAREIEALIFSQCMNNTNEYNKRIRLVDGNITSAGARPIVSSMLHDTITVLEFINTPSEKFAGEEVTKERENAELEAKQDHILKPNTQIVIVKRGKAGVESVAVGSDTGLPIHGFISPPPSLPSTAHTHASTIPLPASSTESHRDVESDDDMQLNYHSDIHPPPAVSSAISNTDHDTDPLSTMPPLPLDRSLDTSPVPSFAISSSSKTVDVAGEGEGEEVRLNVIGQKYSSPGTHTPQEDDGDGSHTPTLTDDLFDSPDHSHADVTPPYQSSDWASTSASTSDPAPVRNRVVRAVPLPSSSSLSRRAPKQESPRSKAEQYFQSFQPKPKPAPPPSKPIDMGPLSNIVTLTSPLQPTTLPLTTPTPPSSNSRARHIPRRSQPPHTSATSHSFSPPSHSRSPTDSAPSPSPSHSHSHTSIALTNRPRPDGKVTLSSPFWHGILTLNRESPPLSFDIVAVGGDTYINSLSSTMDLTDIKQNIANSLKALLSPVRIIAIPGRIRAQDAFELILAAHKGVQHIVALCTLNLHDPQQRTFVKHVTHHHLTKSRIALLEAKESSKLFKGYMFFWNEDVPAENQPVSFQQVCSLFNTHVNKEQCTLTVHTSQSEGPVKAFKIVVLIVIVRNDLKAPLQIPPSSTAVNLTQTPPLPPLASQPHTTPPSQPPLHPNQHFSPPVVASLPLSYPSTPPFTQTPSSLPQLPSFTYTQSFPTAPLPNTVAHPTSYPTPPYPNLNPHQHPPHSHPYSQPTVPPSSFPYSHLPPPAHPHFTPPSSTHTIPQTPLPVHFPFPSPPPAPPLPPPGNAVPVLPSPLVGVSLSQAEQIAQIEAMLEAAKRGMPIIPIQGQSQGIGVNVSGTSENLNGGGGDTNPGTKRSRTTSESRESNKRHKPTEHSPDNQQSDRDRDRNKNRETGKQREREREKEKERHEDRRREAGGAYGKEARDRERDRDREGDRSTDSDRGEGKGYVDGGHDRGRKREENDRDRGREREREKVSDRVYRRRSRTRSPVHDPPPSHFSAYNSTHQYHAPTHSGPTVYRPPVSLPSPHSWRPPAPVVAPASFPAYTPSSPITPVPPPHHHTRQGNPLSTSTYPSYSFSSPSIDPLRHYPFSVSIAGPPMFRKDELLQVRVGDRWERGLVLVVCPPSQTDPGHNYYNIQLVDLHRTDIVREDFLRKA